MSFAEPGVSSKGRSLLVAGGDVDGADHLDQEDDALTEATSQDDPVHDAFHKALNDSDPDIEEVADQEDEIVWNPG